MTDPQPPRERRRADRRAGGDRRQQSRSGVVLVELVRLVIVAGFTAGGYQIARAAVEEESTRVLAITLLGASLGYVVGGALGRSVGKLVGVAERRIAATPGADFVAGGLGMLVGGLIASIVSWPLLLLPSRAVGVPMLAFVLVILGYLGYRIGVIKREDVLQLIGLTYRTRAGDLRVLDTSAVLDPRLLDYVRAGLMRGTMLLPGFVLEEVQGIADSADSVRRGRARVGLETLQELRREGLVDVQFVDKTYPQFDEVDAKVMGLARERGATVVTDDLALARVAELQGIEVVLMRQIAAALRPGVLPGERVTLTLIRTGTEGDQAVGYLDDGTLVVVEHAASLIGSSVQATIARAVSTKGGRMLFATLSSDGGEHA